MEDFMFKNKIIAGAIALCIIGGSLPFSGTVIPELLITANAETEYTEGTYGVLTYKKYGDHIEISACDASATSVDIPDKIDGLPVTEIGNFAFYLVKNLAQVKISDSVTVIGQDAFYSCDALTSISIPGSVNEIKRMAFYDCSGLTSLTLGNGVENIGYAAFYGCTGLTSFSLPDSITGIGNDAFGSTSWYDNQPDGSVYIGNVYYEYKGDMPENTKITIKNGTKVLADNAFENLTVLTSAELPDSLEYIGTRSFTGCTGLTSMTIPDSVKGVGYEAFYGCSNISGTITLSKNCNIFEMDAFYKCSSLDALVFMNPQCEIGDSAYNTAFATEIHGYTGSTAQDYAKKYGRIFKALDVVVMGDINDDGTIDARDASMALSEYALIATGGAPTFTDAQKLAANVNDDSVIDARDASIILSYYAYIATGGTDSFEDFLK